MIKGQAMSDAIKLFVTELETLEIEIETSNRVPQLSVKHYNNPEYKNRLELLHKMASDQVGMMDAFELKRLRAIFNRYNKFWDLFEQMVANYPFNVTLGTELYPLFIGADPRGIGNITDDSIHDLNELMTMREGLLKALRTASTRDHI